MFKDFIFHENAFKKLLKHQDRIPHAILLSGVKGIGKLEFAIQMATSLLCQKPQPDQMACGQCKACLWVTAETHPDLMQVGLEMSSNDKLSKEIKVDQIRVLCNKLVQTSQFGGYKIAIIHPAENMNRNAANSLLKTLEEPAHNTIIVLLSDQPSKLPLTIVSRCRHIKLKKPPADKVIAWLKTEYPQANTEALMAASEGTPKYAVEIVDTALLELRMEVFESFLAVASEGKDPLAMAALCQKVPLNWVMQWMLSWVEDLVKLRCGSDTINNQDLLKSLQALAKRIDLTPLFEFYDHLRQTTQWLQSSANIQLLLEAMFLKWSAVYNNIHQ